MTDNIIDVQKLGRSFGQKVALSDMNLSVRKGSVLGLVGENGAGKTTLIKHLLGLLRAQQGSVRVFDQDPVADPVGVLSRIGYLSEDRDAPMWMRISDYLAYMKAFFPAWDDAYANELIELFELDAKQRLKSLSRGQLARAALLAALAHRPELLIFDEPSSGLDPIVRRDILAAIIRTAADEGRTVLFSSHLLDEVQRVSDDVAMIHQGKLVLSSPLDEVLTSHERLVIRFPDSLDVPPRIDSALSCEGAGPEWSIVCNGQRDLVQAHVAALNAEIVERAAPTLEEIFVARIGGRAEAEADPDPHLERS